MIDYAHPAAAKILEDCLSILQNSETALRLIETLKASPYQIKIFKTLYPQPFVPNETLLYLGIPSTQDYADIEQVIDLAAGMTELKQLREGQTRPSSDPRHEDNLQRQHLRNLDIMLYSFPIVEELELSGYKARQAVERTGYKKLYTAWLREAPYEEFINIYWGML